jgi:hypothetical protein
VTLSVQEARTILNRGHPHHPTARIRRKETIMSKRHVVFCYIVLPIAAVLLPLVGGRLWVSIMLLAVVALNVIVDTLLKEK